jgi:hypothetical protein
LARAKTLYDAMEFDRVIPLASAVLGRVDITLDERLDAHLLHGTSLAIVGDPVEAEKTFRLLLRARPEFRMAEDTPPKILAVFRKVQAEENETQRLLAEAQRKKVVASLELKGGIAAKVAGGFPLVFRYRIKDPLGAVDTLDVEYRRQGAASFSSLALSQRGDGQWVGLIPGEWTANETDFVVEYIVVTRDKEGPLLTLGTTKEPLRETVPRGDVQDAIPPPVPLWAFTAGALGTSALAVVAAGLAVGVQLTQSDFDRLVDQAQTSAIDGQQLNSVINRGQQLMVLQWIGLGLTGLATIGLGASAPFVNWSGQQPIDPEALLAGTEGE